MTENEFTYWAFISYSQQDNHEQCSDTPTAGDLCWGDWLHDELKNFAIPVTFAGQINARGEIIPERVAPVFQDKEDQWDNASLCESVRQALERSKCLVVICSPRSAKSLHVNEVVRYFKQLGHGNLILPLVIAGEPNASDGNKLGISPDDECFVPALRHPVKPDGTLDISRRERGSIFADARHGDVKREFLARDSANGEIELETAKVQLIAGLIGVGFNGLWGHELKRRFTEAKIPAREIHKLANTAPEINDEILAAEHQARAAQSQIQELRNQVEAAQSQTREVQQQARETQIQLEETRNQVREAQSKFWGIQNLPPDVKSQIEEAQTKAREAQNRIEAARNQVQAAESKVLEAQDQVRLAQTQVQEIQNMNQAARRLTRIFAVMAVLTLMAAASLTLWQQKKIAEAQTKAAAGETDLAAGTLNRKQIQQALQKFAAVGNDSNLLRSLDELSSRIPTEETSNTLNAAAVILNDAQRSQFQEQLLNSWMRTNWPAAFDWSCQLTNVDSRQRALEKIIPAVAADNLPSTLARLNDLTPAPSDKIYTQLFQCWAAKDPVQAIEQRPQVPGHDTDAKILSAILTVWADQQPEAALNWLQSQPDSQSKYKALDASIGQLADTDIPKALTLAQSLPEGVWRNAVIACLFDAWAAKDLEVASTACQQLPEGAAKEKAWACVLSQRILKDPASAAEQVIKLGAGDYRRIAISGLCGRWSDLDTPAALAWAQSLTSENERSAAINRVLINSAHKDPCAAAQFAVKHPEVSGTALGVIVSAWFQEDFPATTNWVACLPAGEKKDAALLAVTETWAQKDVKGMAAYAFTLPAGDVQAQYLTTACRHLAAGGFAAVVELLQPLADASLRQSILEQTAYECDLPQMDLTAKYIATMPADNDQQAAIKGLVSSWSSTAPETAVNWLCAFPETNSQPEQVRSVINAWSQTEPAAVAKWLANLPAGTANEGIIGAFLDGAAAKYPDYAAQWIQSVTDETQRQKYQIQVARQWMKTDASAATKWIDSLSLPEETKHSLKTSSP